MIPSQIPEESFQNNFWERAPRIFKKKSKIPVHLDFKQVGSKSEQRKTTIHI